MGVSHIPIREAIRQLEAEGLIVAPPRRTPVVAGVDLDDLAAIYELRRMIELPTVRRRRRVLGAGHPRTLASAGNLAADLERLGDHSAAEALRADVKHRRSGQAGAPPDEEP